MGTKIDRFRVLMNQMNCDAFTLTCSDPHLSEYIPDRWKSMEWISRFKGTGGEESILSITYIITN